MRLTNRVVMVIGACLTVTAAGSSCGNAEGVAQEVGGSSKAVVTKEGVTMKLGCRDVAAALGDIITGMHALQVRPDEGEDAKNNLAKCRWGDETETRTLFITAERETPRLKPDQLRKDSEDFATSVAPEYFIERPAFITEEGGFIAVRSDSPRTLPNEEYTTSMIMQLSTRRVYLVANDVTVGEGLSAMSRIYPLL